MSRHIITTEETVFAITNADGTLIYGVAPAETNISTGQEVCEISTDEESSYYDLISADAVEWSVGVKVENLPVSYNEELYRVIQPHITQADWTPDIVPALFVLIPPPTASGYPEWVQPTGAHDAYNIGDRVSFNGNVYESVIDANVWSPTVYPAGWSQIN